MARIQSGLFRILTAAGAAMMAGGTVFALTVGRSRVIAAVDDEVSSDAWQHRSMLDSHFERARVIAQVMGQNTAYPEYFANPDSPNFADGTARIAVIDDSLAYLEQLYPDSIGEVCLIATNGAEAARVVRGSRAHSGELSDDESGNPFFGPTLAVAAGHVYQAAPYISPDTGEWVISNSTVVAGRSGPAGMVHFEVTLESIRRSTASESAHVWVIDAQTGRVVIDSERPITASDDLSRAPIFGEGREGTGFDRRVGRSSWLGSRRVAFESINGGVDNANHWLVAVASVHSIGWWSGFDVFSGAGIVFGLALVVVAALAGRDHRRRVHESVTDELTGLGNRRMLAVGLRTALDEGRTHRTNTGLLLVDLDGFKEVNDTLGHAAGDQLLRVVATRLLEATRSDDTVVRLGGDEFAVVVPGVPSTADLLNIADRFLLSIEATSLIDGVPVAVKASLGAVLGPGQGDTGELLLRHADVAMYEAKRAGVGICLYDEERDPYRPDRLALASRLSAAIESGELAVHFQPIAVASTGRWAEVEALVRWPESGLTPTEVIEIAETSGLMRELTDEVLRHGLAEIGRWRSAGFDLYLTVNLSAHNLMEADLVGRVRASLHRAQLPGSILEFELTETAVIADHDRAYSVMAELKALGVRMSIDDYGTGNTSISYLRRLPVDRVKIDRTFVAGMLESSADAAVVRTTIDLAHSLDLLVVAEGVETMAQLDVLRALGCDLVQGYLLARPMPADALTERLDVDARRIGELDLSS